MSRFITFYLEDKNLGTYAIYGDAEQMCSISFEDAQKEFEKHILDESLDKSNIIQELILKEKIILWTQ